MLIEIICFLTILVILAGIGVSKSTAAEINDKDIALEVEKIRRAYREMIPLAGEGDRTVSVRDITIQADKPARKITLRVYSPRQAEFQANLPLFLFMHGGGFISGDMDTHDVLLRAIANGGECVVVSVDYRLAPENPFPAGLEDSYAALLWSWENASDIGADSAKIVIGGDSAGGNIATVAAMLSRDRKGPELLGQWLMYPSVSNKMDTESWAKLGDEYFPTRAENLFVIAAYVPEGRSPYEPLIAPLWADLKNLPPTLIQAGGFDPLHDECRVFAQKLEQNGNNAKFLLYPQSQHGFLQFYQNREMFPGGEAALEQGLDWLREIFS